DDAVLDTYTSERRDHCRAMVDLSLTMGKIIKITNPAVVVARDVISNALNLLPGVKSYFSDMRFKPMPRYTEGVLVDPTTHKAGKATATLTSTLIPVATANTRISPVGVQFPQPDVTTAHGPQELDDSMGNWWTSIVWGNDPKDVLPPASLQKLHELGAQLVSVVPITQLEWAQRDTAPDVLVVADPT